MITSDDFSDNTNKKFGKGASAKSRRGVPHGLDELFINKLKVIYTVEKILVDMIPRLIQALHSIELKSALSMHIEIRLFHIKSLKKIFASFKGKAEIAHSKVMELLVVEIEKTIESKTNEQNIDLKLLSISQKIVINQIAIYSSLYSFSKALEEEYASELIKEVLEQEISIYDYISTMLRSYLRKINHDKADFIAHSPNSKYK
jgi:ferritin-like metal-binding protein YciE